jgi:tetratricopeptide (TPR) repeat protein
MIKSTCLSIRKRVVYFALFTLLFVSGTASNALADNYLQVAGTYNDGQDTVGRVEHFLEFGSKIPVFIAPYTLHFRVFPLADSTFQIKIDCFELGPSYNFFQKELTANEGEINTITDLPSKGLKFDYSFMVVNDTTNYSNIILIDSLTNFESVHFKAHILRDSYADYKWNPRSSYLENIFDNYRKELSVTRGGKANFYIYPARNNSPFIDLYTGIGYDISGNNLYTVFNKEFDTAISSVFQKFVIYDTWGYSSRFLVVGFSRIFQDDIYLAREYIKNMTLSEIKNELTNEFPTDIERVDILSGAYAKFLIDKYGLADYKKLYTKSYPGNFAFENVYQKDFQTLLKAFINYEKKLELNESKASYFSDYYSAQMWFDKVLDYRIWLASQPLRKGQHLNKLATLYFYLGEYAQSESSYSKLVDLEPKKIQAKYLLGLSYIRNNKIDLGIKEFTGIVDSLPNASKMLAELYLDQNQYEKAKNCLNGIEGIPDSKTSILKARLQLALGNSILADSILNIALTLSNNVISLVPSEARGYINSAYVHMFSSSFQEADNLLQIALFVENRPYYLSQANLALGRLYNLKGDHQTAEKYYDTVIQSNSSKYMKSLAKNYISNPYKIQ